MQENFTNFANIARLAKNFLHTNEIFCTQIINLYFLRTLCQFLKVEGISSIPKFARQGNCLRPKFKWFSCRENVLFYNIKSVTLPSYNYFINVHLKLMKAESGFLEQNKIFFFVKNTVKYFFPVFENNINKLIMHLIIAVVIIGRGTERWGGCHPPLIFRLANQLTYENNLKA